ncbi:IclR family transcriptional regulator domain-containing protein [Agromyces atrinae]|uniref:Glycerol operon regulatory protein n=1 Tax=Agromyces atrinae TaxID=592376 RepID=A0A4V1R2N1_9MICO|nr:IclR family transcriptional regulator C-terminal domain-containing protein [Agromyces atrinae]NYD68118.1 IclR family pca regulon transcriptional regulator [Agromyces atrinae]RXZ87736.1 IclR family transcriptional regulator [Agromyces atrinae]
MQTEPSSEFIQSLARGLDVITAFSAERPEMTLSDVAQATGLTRASARRFLLTLTTLGYMQTDGRLFSLTPHVLRLGFSYLSALSLPDVARPHLERLSQRLGESTSASVLDGDDIVYVARVPVRRIMAVGITIGTRFPAVTTSMGRVLLAALPPAETDAAIEHSPQIDRDAVRRAVADAGTQGWCIVDQELEVGLRSAAAPLRRAGSVVGAINVSTSTATTTLERLRDEFVPALVETAAAISSDLERTGS